MDFVDDNFEKEYFIVSLALGVTQFKSQLNSLFARITEDGRYEDIGKLKEVETILNKDSIKTFESIMDWLKTSDIHEEQFVNCCCIIKHLSEIGDSMEQSQCTLEGANKCLEWIADAPSLLLENLIEGHI